MTKIYKPRGDFCLVRITDLGFVRSVAVPNRSAQGKQYTIEAIGPKVEDLKVGDKVMCIGTVGEAVIFLPDDNNLFITRESNVVFTIEEEEQIIDLTIGRHSE